MPHDYDVIMRGKKMKQFKKTIATYTTMLALLSLTSTSVYAVQQTNVGTVLNNTNDLVITNTGTLKTDVNFKQDAGAGAVSQVDWKDLNVEKDQWLNFGFSNASQIIVNRVLGGQTSRFFGKMTSSCIANSGNCGGLGAASGKVVLINPAGVLFGASSQVDLNAFTVSTNDFKGAKNLANVKDFDDYQKNVLNPLSRISEIDGITKYGFNIIFDKDETIKNGNFVMPNTTYTESLLKTNYSTDGENASSINTKIVTADGITSYREIGNSNNKKQNSDVAVKGDKLVVNKAGDIVIENSKKSHPTVKITGNNLNNIGKVEYQYNEQTSELEGVKITNPNGIPNDVKVEYVNGAKSASTAAANVKTATNSTVKITGNNLNNIGKVEYQYNEQTSELEGVKITNPNGIPNDVKVEYVR